MPLTWRLILRKAGFRARAKPSVAISKMTCIVASICPTTLIEALRLYEPERHYHEPWRSCKKLEIVLLLKVVFVVESEKHARSAEDGPQSLLAGASSLLLTTWGFLSSPTARVVEYLRPA